MIAKLAQVVTMSAFGVAQQTFSEEGKTGRF
jgi:hypothetical protein